MTSEEVDLCHALGLVKFLSDLHQEEMRKEAKCRQERKDCFKSETIGSTLKETGMGTLSVQTISYSGMTPEEEKFAERARARRIIS